MQKTEKYGFNLPEPGEFYNVELVNENTTKTEEVLQSFEDGTTPVGNALKLGDKGASEYITKTKVLNNVNLNTVVEEGNYFITNGKNTSYDSLVLHGFLEVKVFDGNDSTLDSGGTIKCIRQNYYPYNSGSTNLAPPKTRYGWTTSASATATWSFSVWRTFDGRTDIPVMQDGVEYLTNEYYLGKPVYTRSINIGYVAKGTVTTELDFTVLNPLDIVMTNNRSEVLTNSSVVTSLAFGRTSIGLVCTSNFGQIIYIVKYTKE